MTVTPTTLKTDSSERLESLPLGASATTTQSTIVVPSVYAELVRKQLRAGGHFHAELKSDPIDLAYAQLAAQIDVAAEKAAHRRRPPEWADE